MKNKITGIIAIIVVFIIGGFALWRGTKEAPILPPLGAVNNFEECAKAGYSIVESYPKQCRAPDGRSFVESIAAQPDKSDLIVVDYPNPNDAISSPLVISGKARGTWYFESSFPVTLKDAQGKILAQAPAQAKGDWMTTDFVPFEATLTFSSAVCLGAAYPCSVPAVLVLEKDNPSGLPEHDDNISIPVKITERTATSSSACKSTGCSGQICSDKDMITTCEFRPEYACYKNARCERQSSRQCGWTQTPELQACLSNPSQSLQSIDSQ